MAVVSRSWCFVTVRVVSYFSLSLVCVQTDFYLRVGYVVVSVVTVATGAGCQTKLRLMCGSRLVDGL